VVRTSGNVLCDWRSACILDIALAHPFQPRRAQTQQWMLIGPTLHFRWRVSNHLFVSWRPLRIVLCAEGCSACELHRGMGHPPSQPTSSVSVCILSVCLSRFLLVCLPCPLACCRAFDLPACPFLLCVDPLAWFAQLAGIFVPCSGEPFPPRKSIAGVFLLC